MGDLNVKNEGSLIEWIKNHSYAIFIAVIIIAIDYGVITTRLAGVENSVENNSRSIKELVKNVDQIEDFQIEMNAVIIQTLKDINSKLERFENKFDKYDEGIQRLYQDYDLKKKN